MSIILPTFSPRSALNGIALLPSTVTVFALSAKNAATSIPVIKITCLVCIAHLVSLGLAKIVQPAVELVNSNSLLLNLQIVQIDGHIFGWFSVCKSAYYCPTTCVADK